MLTNGQVTKQAIDDALFEFLVNTVKEDLVIIFLSNHDMPAPERCAMGPVTVSFPGPCWKVCGATRRR